MKDIEKEMDNYVEFLQMFIDDVKETKTISEKIGSFLAFKLVECIFSKEMAENLKEDMKTKETSKEGVDNE